ncbi:MAG: S-layer homology domain-containing protein [Peptococcaceae bacterium]|nr:MAG: S-layer homology domain-containing protein [Peptococcaceae bacterium]
MRTSYKVEGGWAVLKKALVVLLSVVLMIAVIVPAASGGQKFSDVPDTHWSSKVVGQMVARNILNGYPDGTFRPGKEVTREEFAAMLVRSAGLPLPGIANASFADLPADRWSAPYVEAVKDYLGGYRTDGGTEVFKGEEPALREDVIAALVKARGYKPGAGAADFQEQFKDYGEISETLREYIGLALQNHLVSGYDDGTIRPKGTITRAEAAALLYRAYFGSGSALENLISAQDVYTITGSDNTTAEIGRLLTDKYGQAYIYDGYYDFTVFIRGVPVNIEGMGDLVYVFVRVDPSRYFTFENACRKDRPAIRQRLQNIAQAAAGYFPGRRIIIMLGYTNSFEWDVTEIFGREYTSYNKETNIYKVDRFFHGMLLNGGKIVDEYGKP